MNRSVFMRVFLLVGLLSSPGHAGPALPEAYHRVAEEVGLPGMVLFAVARTESRRMTPLGVRPWPWTLTIEGEGHYYPSSAAALTAAQQALERNRQLGVGLMQIEWRVHHARFASLDEALDPWNNLRVGAQLLKTYADEQGSLWAGIGRYHSAHADLAQRYQARVAEQLIETIEALEEPTQ